MHPPELGQETGPRGPVSWRGTGDPAAAAALQLRSALAGFAHIFPPEAPKPSLPNLVQAWQERIDAPDVAVFAINGPTLVGIVAAGADPREASIGQVAGLYVDPDHWGSGVGRLLHDAAVDHLLAAGFSDVCLWVLEGNRRARAWYERLGWVPTGARLPVWGPGGIDDVGYRLAVPRQEKGPPGPVS
jgi:GNAT superfamily N-acetyltransferase